MKKIAILLCGLLMNASSVFADSSRVDFNGTVQAIPCVVDGAASVDVDLGDIQASTLDTFYVSPYTSFQIKLKNCPAITSATATFSGAFDPAYPGMYKNSGTATRTAIQVGNSDDSQFISSVRPSITKTVAADHTVAFNLVARAYSPTAQPSIPGTISAVLQVDFTYQ
ncbi:fimbrial protein [Buttiauxella selenatireducens]|uniref:Fimbrial protein n=1 Tax=Buttiauxella selenatireducens TaxID=3073902 RepID=A0ABY9S6T4_9ENTR|nr:fimbrial protein [Buttiauxella sp. R73]WMY73217.1 fimbrial protein [Buttiauxella sp. R73]